MSNAKPVVTTKIGGGGGSWMVAMEPWFHREYTALTLLPCPIKSRPTSGDSHDRLPPGVPISS